MAKIAKVQQLTTVLARPDNSSGWHFLWIKPSVADKLGFTGKSRRVVCTLNDKHKFQCALLPSGGSFYIIVNKKIREKLGISAGSKVKVELIKDESKYGLPMPKEFREVLKQDPEGNKLFHKLTAGKQRSILYWLNKIKDIDKRIHTAFILLDHLKNNDGKIVYERLTAELKRPMF
jgi:bifunctional DNA-binding transcriptional regulator/antitoxin component of YhaV-PrlF toxin-antitoxin module